MALMAQPWKHPDNGTYYFRRLVPDDIRAVVGKREWKVSLKTKDLAQARPRFAHESVKCEEVFRNARDHVEGRPVLLASDAHKLADRWASETLASWEANPEGVQDFLVVDQADGVVAASDFLSDYTLDQAFGHVGHFIKDSLSTVRMPLPERSDRVWEVLVGEFSRAYRQVCHVALDRHRDDWRATSKFSAATLRLAHEEKAASAASKSPSLSIVFTGWSEDKVLNDGDNRSTQKTIGEFASAITRFIELHGDLPVDQISRVVCRDFRSNLFKLPTKGKGTRGKSAPELIEKAVVEGLPTAEHSTVNKQLRALSAVLGFANQVLGAIHENPVVASGLIQRSKKAARNQDDDDEKGYTLSELQQIFASPLFRGEWAPKKADFGRALYWMPLLMAYTGARREELAQLLVSDVKEIEGIWCLDLREGEAQSLKTSSSRRKVPLHSDLMALGFLDYLRALPSDGRAFPKLKMHKANGYGHAVGRMWSRYLDNIGVSSDASPSHGFRHTFKTLCRESQIPGEVHDWITGHASGSVGDTYGRNPVSRMAWELKKYPSLARLAGLLPPLAPND